MVSIHGVHIWCPYGAHVWYAKGAYRVVWWYVGTTYEEMVIWRTSGVPKWGPRIGPFLDIDRE